MQDEKLQAEIATRRCFAIISHPDAGKTTLTEKLLLYSGAIELAGAVRKKAQQRHARSDWMAMEQARGISVTSTVLQFDHLGCRFNLLDTPGHQDFSEDTYRVLTAVDSAVMVLDAAKGLEAQTLKLFEICSRRGIPVITFVNKLDQYGRQPIELLDEIERVLGMKAAPINWPIGAGAEFQGVYEFAARRVLRFERIARGERQAPLEVSGLDDPRLRDELGAHSYETLIEDAELLRVAGTAFDLGEFRAARQTPVFFGSALNNFGVQPFLDALAEMASPPAARRTMDGGTIEPADPRFSAFVFKIQANMDPLHRDSMAFVRVVSGRFEKGMTVEHPRLGRPLRLPRAHRIFAQERETTEQAFAGDVVGLVNPGVFAIGDTISSEPGIRFPPLPHFPPETFARLRPVSVDKKKAFQKALLQLEEEGAIQVLHDGRDPILGAVGDLQFDLVQSRMSSEYGVETRLDPLAFRFALQVLGDSDTLELPSGVLLASYRDGRSVVLFEGKWLEESLRVRNPGVRFVPMLASDDALSKDAVPTI